MFTSADTRERHLFIDNALLNTIELLTTTPEIQQAMGPELLADRVEKLRGMYVPNYKDGVVDIPWAYRETDRIPVIAPRLGEVVVAGKGLGMTPMQRQNMYKQIKGWGLKDDSPANIEHEVRGFDTDLRNTRGNSLYEVTNKHHAVVTGTLIKTGLDGSQFKNLGKDEVRRVLGRPIVGLIMLQEVAYGDLYHPGSIIHELQHVEQKVKSPIKPGNQEKFLDDKLRMELEAYYVAALVERALFNSDHEEYRGEEGLLGNDRVEQIRKAHAPKKDPFAPRGAIRKALLEIGLDIT